MEHHKLTVRVTLDDGTTHERTLDHRDDADYRDYKIARSFWSHALITLERPTSAGLSEEQRRAAALVDQCLAIETVFPHLRELLPA